MGTIKVTVQTQDRLEAITELSRAIHVVAKALASQTQIAISDCRLSFMEDEPAINIDTQEEITETIIHEVGEDK